MFTGLVKCLGTIREAAPFGKGRRFRIDLAALAGSVAVGQSVAVNGACLTVTSIAGGEATFDAVSETVNRTNLGRLRPGDRVNLEPALKVGDALDGHMVLGHVDAVAEILRLDAAQADSRVIAIALPEPLRPLVAEKGSIAVDGISLTVATAEADSFTITVIPHTWANSSLAWLKPGDGVNLEADVLARYAMRILRYGGNAGGGAEQGGVTEDLLRRNGFA